MQINTITCHDVYNYGASLQAFALQKHLTSLGHKVQIINYKPDYLSGHHSLTAISNPKYDRFFVRSLYRLAKLPKRLYSLKRKKTFDKFTTQFLQLTAQRYNSRQELENNPPQADIYIAGSDQIWNTLFKNGHDASFYLNFAPSSAKRISYAASFATDCIYNNAEDFVKKMLQNFDAISVRESSALGLLQKLGRNDGTLVCDPVFLLSQEQWADIINRKNTLGRYILVYECEYSETLKNVALKVANEYQAKIVSVSPEKSKFADYNFPNIGPAEFVSFINDACCVVSNSFHGTAFSIIFEKDFYVINRSEHINTRMRDFLEHIGLDNRLVSSADEVGYYPISLDAYQEKLNQLIQTSKKFIDNATK